MWDATQRLGAVVETAVEVARKRPMRLAAVVERW